MQLRDRPSILNRSDNDAAFIGDGMVRWNKEVVVHSHFRTAGEVAHLQPRREGRDIERNWGAQIDKSSIRAYRRAAAQRDCSSGKMEVGAVPFDDYPAE